MAHKEPAALFVVASEIDGLFRDVIKELKAQGRIQGRNLRGRAVGSGAKNI